MLYNSVIMIWEKVGVIVMEDRYNGTVTAILEAGKKEFLTYGYEKASLRRIAKEASVTTGAIYGYFPGKKALFDALTSDTAEELLDLYRKEHRDFAALPPEQQPARLNEITEQYIPWMVNYFYDHFEVFPGFYKKGRNPGMNQGSFSRQGIHRPRCGLTLPAFLRPVSGQVLCCSPWADKKRAQFLTILFPQFTAALSGAV